MRNAILVLIIVVIGAIGFNYFRGASPTSESTPFGVTEGEDSSGYAQPSASSQRAVLDDGKPSGPDNSPPQELIKSIYDYDSTFSQSAQAAAQDMVSYYDRNSYLRWQSVHLDPKLILKGDYLKDGAMPKTLQISPFPDTTFVATQTQYNIMEHIASAIWTGSIEGSESGTVKITIVGGRENPGFVVRIFNGPQSIGISRVEKHTSYVAVESNPHQPGWVD